METKLKRKKNKDQEQELLIKVKLKIEDSLVKIHNKKYANRAQPLPSDTNEIEEEFNHISQKYGNFN